MTETYGAELLADSISPNGVRLTTMWVTFPRFILAEVNTHRMLSRNSNSSRAIPPEIQIEKVRTNPFVPETFNKRVKGMGVGEALVGEAADRAYKVWIAAALDAAEHAETLLALDCDKSRINRLLEPFLWHSAVITATEWDNFFALRDHPSAQPEFQKVAKLMRGVLDFSRPAHVDYGQWHLPGVSDFPYDEQNPDWDFWKRVSAGRLARWTSYGKAPHEDDPADAAHARAEKLVGAFHMSPTEHQARPLEPGEGTRAKPAPKPENVFMGNFRGWMQFRKEIPNEHNAALALNLA